jgi:hypothetical protein
MERLMVRGLWLCRRRGLREAIEDFRRVEMEVWMGEDDLVAFSWDVFIAGPGENMLELPT